MTNEVRRTLLSREPTRREVGSQNPRKAPFPQRLSTIFLYLTQQRAIRQPIVRTWTFGYFTSPRYREKRKKKTNTVTPNVQHFYDSERNKKPNRTEDPRCSSNGNQRCRCFDATTNVARRVGEGRVDRGWRRVGAGQVARDQVVVGVFTLRRSSTGGVVEPGHASDVVLHLDLHRRRQPVAHVLGVRVKVAVPLLRQLSVDEGCAGRKRRRIRNWMIERPLSCAVLGLWTEWRKLENLQRLNVEILIKMN